MKQLFSRLSNFFAPKNEPDQPTSSGSGIDRALSLQKTQDIHHTAPQILRIITKKKKKKFSGGNKNETVYFFSKYAT